MSRLEIALRDHVFTTASPLVVDLGGKRSLQVHLVSEFVNAPLLTALLLNGDSARPYFHYAPNDSAGAGSMQLLPHFFTQCAMAREAIRLLAEKLIAKFGKNKYTTIIYSPNPWGTFDQWETATRVEDTASLSESARSYYTARKRGNGALDDTADSAERRQPAKRARQAAAA
jgi:hypothetical protein